MVKLLAKKKTIKLNGERTEKGVLSFPRFYIKAVTASFSIYHRLTHSYMGSVQTEEELFEILGELNKYSEKELWTRLLRTRGFSIGNLENKTVRSKVYESEEDWYYGAWGIYTTRFYETHPHLFLEEVEPPRAIINEVRQIINDERKREHDKHVASIELAEESYKTGNNPKTVEKPVTEPANSLKTVIKKRLPSIIKREEKPSPPVKEPKKIKRIKLPTPVNPFD